jgi:hypothetical protein
MKTTSGTITKMEYNISKQIVLYIESGNIEAILNNLCYIDNNEIKINYVYFKYFAHTETYDCILNAISNNIDTLLLTNPTFSVHVNMQTINITDVNKHKDYIKYISDYLKNKYPNKLNICYIYNAPFIFAQIYKIISVFIDKETQQKIKVIS